MSPLMYAIQYGPHLDVIETLLSHKADPSIESKDGVTAVHVAISLGLKQTLQKLLQSGADGSISDRHGRTPLHYAVSMSKGDSEILSWLLSGKLGQVDANAVDESGRTPLMYAAGQGDITAVNALLRAGARADLEDKQGLTVIQAAISANSVPTLRALLQHLKERGDAAKVLVGGGVSPLHMLSVCSDEMVDTIFEELEALDEETRLRVVNAPAKQTGGSPLLSASKLSVLSRLLKAGADPNCRDANGVTAVHVAASWRGENADRGVAMLLEHGAEITVDANGRTPLHYAQQGNVVSLLLDRGVSVAARDRSGMSSLHQACMTGNTEIVRVLCAAGAPVDVADNEGRTPLHLAAMIPGDVGDTCFASVVRSSGAGAAAAREDRNGYTPLFYAASTGKAQACRELIKIKGVDVRASSKEGYTCLHAAASSGSAATVRVLATAGAPVNAPDARSLTPLHHAILKGDLECTRALLKAGADPTARAKDATTLQIAMSTQNRQMIELLLSSGAKPTQTEQQLLRQLGLRV
eukprot:Rmarinus@m.11068